MIANSISSLTAHLYARSSRTNRRHNFDRLGRDQSLGAIIQKASAAVAKKIAGADLLKVQAFLVSPEAETIVRQIYALSHVEETSVTVRDIKSEFALALAFNTGLSVEEASPIASPIFEALLASVETSLKFAAERGSPDAREALGGRQTRILFDELKAVAKSLEFFSANASGSIDAINAFERQLRNQIVVRYAGITPPHFDSAHKIPIDDLYVSPDLILESDKQFESMDLWSYLGGMYRAVLLGDPGAGKSTLSHKVCHDLAKHPDERRIGGRRVTAVLVVLRDYGAFRKDHPCTIMEYIEASAKILYQLTAPREAFSYLALNGRLMVIFDGLDELLDTSYRKEVSGDVEVFCSLYPAIPVLVTSRRVGYNQAPLDPSTFDTAFLAPFKDDKITEYATKWFGSDGNLSEEEKPQKAASFLRESAAVTDLRSNPLMLALMCNIYRGENYIPQNRPEVYEKCATMLFERWDKGRGLHVNLPFEAHVRPAMMDIAFWIYSSEEYQGGVREQLLIARASEYLASWRFEDLEEARRAATQFVDFCSGRAWVFTDVGTTKEGERLYQFTHRTFLEFFAGAYLARRYETAEQLWQALRERIERGEWDVVAQLAYQIKSRTSEGACDQLLLILVDFWKSDDTDAGTNALSFAARCLEFLVPKPLVKRAIVDACVEMCVKLGKMRGMRVARSTPDQSMPADLLVELTGCSTENRASIAKYLEEILVSKIESGDREEAYISWEIGSFLPALAGARDHGLDEPDIWRLTAEAINRASVEKLKATQMDSLPVSISLLGRQQISLEDFINRHGLGMFYRRSNMKIMNDSIMSFAENFLTALLWPEQPLDINDSVVPIVEKLGKIFAESLPAELPLFTGGIGFNGGFVPRPGDHVGFQATGDFWFGLFVLLAAQFERLKGDVNRSIIESKLVAGLLPLLQARGRLGETQDLQAIVMDDLGFSGKQRELVFGWLVGEIAFSELPSARLADQASA